eukprot:3297175-Amphidinium_carterae.1
MEHHHKHERIDTLKAQEGVSQELCMHPLVNMKQPILQEQCYGSYIIMGDFAFSHFVKSDPRYVLTVPSKKITDRLKYIAELILRELQTSLPTY